jgi:peptidoglycan/LPS O-acetylase OafA/YrhL
MQDAELLLSLAGIAGVFVGFGALISVRSGGLREAGEVYVVRYVVSLGIWVVIAAIAPAIVNRYAIAGHELWLVCSLLALALFAVVFVANARAPEGRPGRAAALAATPRALAMTMVQAVATVWLPTASMVLALALVALGLFPDQEPALYLTAVAAVLFGAALSLLYVVFLQPYPAAASGSAALAATGGSSA